MNLETGKSQKIPYQFKDIKKAIKMEVDIDLQHYQLYSTVNAIRVLNNVFKHSDGCCALDSDNYNLIKKSNLTAKALTCGSIGKKVMVEYSKPPIRDVLDACNKFCSDLLDSVEKKLKDNP